MLRFWLCLGALASLSITSDPAAAQIDRPVRLIVPFGAGGTTDVAARAVAEGMSVEIGQPVIIENKAGAGGRIGLSEVSRARADGHTLIFTSLDVIASAEPGGGALVPVGPTGSIPYVLAAKPSIRSLSDLRVSAHPRLEVPAWARSPTLWESTFSRLLVLQVSTFLFAQKPVSFPKSYAAMSMLPSFLFQA